jgi:hypothetical protein
VGISIAVVVLVGFLVSKRIAGDSANFLVGGRMLPLALVGGALMGSAVDTNATLGNTDLAAEFGFWAGACLLLGLALCLLLTYFMQRIFAAKSPETARRTAWWCHSSSDWCGARAPPRRRWCRSSSDCPCGSCFFAMTPTMYGLDNTILYIPNAVVDASFDGWPTFIAFAASLVTYVVTALVMPAAPIRGLDIHFA